MAGVPQRPQPLDDLAFKAVVTAAIRDAVSFAEEDVSTEREAAINYFLGKPFGDEPEGRSKVVITEVRDTILAVLPSLLRIFCSTERAVEFAPQGPEDEAFAEQATDYVNWVVLRDNPWFRIVVIWLIDGLLCKVGVVKYGWEEKTTVAEREYSGLTLEEAAVLVASPDVEMVDHKVTPADGETPELHSFKLRTKTAKGRLPIDNVPPEEFLINRQARSLDDARLLAHRRKITISDLVALGYDWDDVHDLSGDDSLDMASEEIARRDYEDQHDDDSVSDPSMREVLYTEAFIYVDKDGDGIAELRRVCVGGNEGRILHDEVVDGHPFAAWCPVPMPHRFYGLSQADLTMDLQRIKSVLWRQTLDNLVLANNPRRAVIEPDIVDMGEVLNEELGAVIRMRRAGAVQDLAVPFVAGQSIAVMEALDAVKADRTGITRASNGLDPDALQSTTRAAVAATVSAAQGKVEMLARLFAEDGMRTLFRGLLRLIVRHQDRPTVIRLRGQWVQMDPRAWNAEMDVTVNVGLGRGNDDDRMAALMAIAGRQEAILLKLGPSNPLVQLPQYRHTLAKMAEIAGFPDAGQFFLDPAAQPPMQPQPSPEQQQAQAQLQLEQAKAQAKMQVDAQKVQVDATIAMRRLEMEMALQRERTQAELQLKREQMAAELELKQRQSMVEAMTGANVQQAQVGGEAG